MTLVQEALRYLSKGFSVIPVNPSLKEEFEKMPYIPWTEFQSRRPSEKEIRGWWTRWPKAMIGVVTGKISNLLSVDADAEQAIEKANELIPDSLEIPTVDTPRGGKHYHFSYHDGIRNSNDGLLHVRLISDSLRKWIQRNQELRRQKSCYGTTPCQSVEPAVVS